jgi:photosystem II biogenesis protein Psp29
MTPPSHATACSCRPSKLYNIAFRPATTRRATSNSVVQVLAAVQGPPTVADAKAAFMSAFNKPLPTIYSSVIFELLVQQHLFRWNKNYSYSEVAALGLCSIFDQVLEGLPAAERDLVFTAYITALQEDPARYRDDAAKMEEWAKSLSGPEALTPSADGNEGAQALAAVAEKVKAGNFLYTKFFAVGLFRMLELTPGGKDPKALSSLVSALGLEQERVNADLMTYKGVLSKLQAAKDIMREFMEREKKKQAERMAEKAAKAEAAAATSAASSETDGAQTAGA